MSDPKTVAEDLVDRGIVGFTPIFRAPREVIQTAALVWCRLCGVTLDGMGGPKHEAMCVECAGETCADLTSQYRDRIPLLGRPSK